MNYEKETVEKSKIIEEIIVNNISQKSFNQCCFQL